MASVHPQNLLETVEVDEKQKEEEEKAEKDKRNEVYWAYQFYVLGVGPALFCLISVSFVNVVVRTSKSCPTFFMKECLLVCLALAYMYLFLYGWMIVGPIPFRKKVKHLKKIMLTFTFVSFIWYMMLLGMLFSNASPCKFSAPTMYKAFQFQVYGGVFILVSFIVKAASDRYRTIQMEKEREKWKELGAQMQQEESEDEEEEESEEDDDENEDGDEDDQRQDGLEDELDDEEEEGEDEEEEDEEGEEDEEEDDDEDEEEEEGNKKDEQEKTSKT